METRTLGHTGLVVPVIGMGTWQTFDVRGAGAELDRRSLVDQALQGGATLFDSSPMYGEAERVLALALEGRRERAIVATKVWTESDDVAEQQIAQALRWYGGYVDIYQVHNLVAFDRRLARLCELAGDGRVRVVGATHYRHDAFPALCRAMQTGQVAQVQLPYNVLDREAERELLPTAETHGVGVLVMQPLDTGALVHHTPDAEALRPLHAFGVRTWPQVLLKWILSDPRVHAVLPATSKPDHLRDNLAAGDPPWFDAETRAYVVRLAEGLA